MSRETLEWLNNMTLIGDTDLRGHAWHYRMGADNHRPGAIPLEEVRRLLLPYEPMKQPLYIKVNGEYREVPNFVGMVSEENPDDVYAVNGGDYQIHPYKEWLINNVFNLVDGDLHISSTGLLAKGAVAWVELAIAENHTIADFEYRPHLLASTSANGRYRTTYGRKIQAVVCDNTLDIADREQGQSISFKHSKDSVARINTVREATGLIIASAAAFDEEVSRLIDWKVPSRVFSKWLDEMIPTKDKETGLLKTGAALTRLESKREAMAAMWRNDDRVAPWSGTAFGVLQLNNTWTHHHTGANKNTVRPERNMLDSISGKTGDSDQLALTVLAKVSN